MSGKFNPILCNTTRSGIVENIHRGIICCVQALPDRNYEIVYSCGDIDQLFYPRSAMKLVQILPLIESGAADYYGFTNDELAIMCASHNAEPFHLTTVRSILSKAVIEESELKCGGHTPISESAAFQYVRDGANNFNDHIYNNCSGKHAGFLALCKYLGLPKENYLSYDHPIQQLIKEAVFDIFNVDDNSCHIGVDGCSAPAFALSARSCAIGYARLCQSAKYHTTIARANAIQRMISAVTTHSNMVYGTNGFCTTLMEEFKGQVIGKRGAAGVYLSGIVGFGLGCAVKIDDGTMGPQYNVTMRFLDWASEYLSKKLNLSINGEEGSFVDVVEGEGDTKEEEKYRLILECLKSKKLTAFRSTPIFTSMHACIGNTECSPDIFCSSK